MKNSTRWFGLTVVIGLSVCAPAFAQSPDPNAQQPSPENHWEIEATSYFWLQGTHGDVNAFAKTVPFKVSPTKSGGGPLPLPAQRED